MRKAICLLIAGAVLLVSGGLHAAQDAIELSPAAPYERFIIYETLAIFWIAIIGLVVIVRLKLREIERTQRLGVDREEKDIPLLD